MKSKAVKWYKRVLYHFLELALVNSFILNKATTSMPLYKFKVDVALALCTVTSLATLATSSQSF